MTVYRTILTTDEFDNFVNSIPRSGMLVFANNKVLNAKREDHTLTLKGLFFKTTATINSMDTESTGTESIVIMKTRYRLPFYFITLFLLVFLFMFMFAEKVTINGNPDPSTLDRLGFVMIGLLLFLIPITLFVKLKSDFIKNIEQELKLIKTPANNT
jgi:hypothetical protein